MIGRTNRTLSWKILNGYIFKLNVKGKFHPTLIICWTLSLFEWSVVISPSLPRSVVSFIQIVEILLAWFCILFSFVHREVYVAERTGYFVCRLLDEVHDTHFIYRIKANRVNCLLFFRISNCSEWYEACCQGKLGGFVPWIPENDGRSGWGLLLRFAPNFIRNLNNMFF